VDSRERELGRLAKDSQDAEAGLYRWWIRRGEVPRELVLMYLLGYEPTRGCGLRREDLIGNREARSPFGYYTSIYSGGVCGVGFFLTDVRYASPEYGQLCDTLSHDLMRWVIQWLLIKHYERLHPTAERIGNQAWGVMECDYLHPLWYEIDELTGELSLRTPVWLRQKCNRDVLMCSAGYLHFLQDITRRVDFHVTRSHFSHNSFIDGVVNSVRVLDDWRLGFSRMIEFLRGRLLSRY